MHKSLLSHYPPHSKEGMKEQYVALLPKFVELVKANEEGTCVYYGFVSDDNYLRSIWYIIIHFRINITHIISTCYVYTKGWTDRRRLSYLP